MTWQDSQEIGLDETWDVNDPAPTERAWRARLREAWLLGPAVLGLLVLGGFALVAGRVATRADLLGLVAGPLAPYAATAAALVVAASAGLLFVSVTVWRLRHEGRRLELTQEGLVEEVSQEFDKVRDALERAGEELARVAARVARAGASADRVERDVRWLDERVAVLETRLPATTVSPRAPSPAPAGEPMEPTTVAVKVISGPDVRNGRGR